MGTQQCQLAISVGAQGCYPTRQLTVVQLASGTQRAQMGAVDSVGPQRSLRSLLEWPQG